MRYVVFGDTGGHFQQLKNGLIKAGMSEDYVLPKDTTIIHCGDLVNKGPHSNELVFMVEEIRLKNPNRWIQIMGNHEAQYLGGYHFTDNNTLDSTGSTILRKWNMQNFIHLIYCIPEHAKVVTSQEEYYLKKPTILSHAGLSYPFWKMYLKKYKMKDYNDILNNTPIFTVHKPGIMLGEYYNIKSPTGPIWAHGIHEVWTLWQQKNKAKFNQFVGHIFPYQFDEINNFFEGTTEEFINVAQLHYEESITTAPLNKNKDTWMFYMDPGYSNASYHDTQPFVEIFTN